MNSEMPMAAYSSMRSATSAWLPTSAVPAPPRTSPIPAHRFGATVRPRGAPPSLGLAPGQAFLHGADRGVVDPLEQPVGDAPGLIGGVPGDDVQPDAETRRVEALLGRERLDPAELAVHRARRLAPGGGGVGVPRGDR